MADSAETVKCRILCLSDTHSGREGYKSPLFSANGAFSSPFPEADILLHSGDLTMTGQEKEYEASLDLLKHFKAELKLVIAGNHDLTLDKAWYAANPSGPLGGLQFGFKNDTSLPDIAEKLLTGDKAKEAGVTFLTEGLHTFTLSNGAKFTVYASPWQPEFCNWAFNYPHHEDRWNPPELIEREEAYQTDIKTSKKIVPAPIVRDPHPIPEGAVVDLCITHGPPWNHLDTCIPSGFKAGCPHLLRALDRVRPRLHVFGHIHEGWGAHRVAWADRAAPGNASTGGLGEKTTAIGAIGDAPITPEDADVKQRRAAHVDVSKSGNQPLEFGKETLMVNASIVDLKYKPTNAVWLVEMELPRGKD